MVEQFAAFFVDERGATAIEYGLIAALVSLAGVVGLTAMGQSLSTLWGSVSNSMSSAAG
jgi:pilus assembly protein Flp/PilA